MKQKALKTLHQLLSTQLQSVAKDLSALQDAKENDTKSSMGDKYETSAEMLRAEQDKLSAQRAKLQKFLVQLDSYINSKSANVVKLGSLVETNKGVFFIGIPFGQFKVEDKAIMAISAASPVGQLMLGKKVGEEFGFRGMEYLLENID